MEELAKRLQHERPLRVALPRFYNSLMKELEKENIHVYDIQGKAVEKQTGYQVNIYYGEAFSQTASQFFSHTSIEKLDESVAEYIQGLTEKCKKVMIADYFKMMKM